jgi:hypothetical protein
MIIGTIERSRLESANALVQFMSRNGQNVFLFQGRVGRAEFGGDKLVWIDEYSNKPTNISRGHWQDWKSSITHGSTLRGFIELLRNYILRGIQLDVDHVFTGAWSDNKEENEALKTFAINAGIGKPQPAVTSNTK